MVFGVEEYYAMRGIEAYYGGRRRKYVGASMYTSTNYCNSLFVNTPYYTRTRSGGFPFARYVYSLNYAVPTLSVYHEKYYLFEMSVSLNWWLLNRVWNNDEIEFQLNGYFEPMYYVSTHGGVFITQRLNYHYNHNNQSTSPTPTSLLF